MKEYIGFKWEDLKVSQRVRLADKAHALGYKHTHEFLLDNLKIKYIDNYYCLSKEYFQHLPNYLWWQVWEDELEKATPVYLRQMKELGVEDCSSE